MGPRVGRTHWPRQRRRMQAKRRQHACAGSAQQPRRSAVSACSGDANRVQPCADHWRQLLANAPLLTAVDQFKQPQPSILSPMHAEDGNTSIGCGLTTPLPRCSILAVWRVACHTSQLSPSPPARALLWSFASNSSRARALTMALCLTVHGLHNTDKA